MRSPRKPIEAKSCGKQLPDYRRALALLREENGRVRPRADDDASRHELPFRWRSVPSPSN